MFYRHERLAVFIDGSNLYSASRGLGFDVDYKKLKDEFARRGTLVRAHYYTTHLENDEYSPIRPLVDWLNYNGFTTISKPAREFSDSVGRRRIKGGIEVELTVDALQLADSVQHVVLFVGDRDYKPLVCALQSKGVRVSVASTIRSAQGVIADDLRRQADNFIELEDLREMIGRAPKHDHSDHHGGSDSAGRTGDADSSQSDQKAAG